METKIFKAKRINSEEWVSGFYCEKTILRNKKTETIPILIKEFSVTGMEAYEIDPKTLCSPIGITLKNKAVYTNDLFYDKELDIYYHAIWHPGSNSYCFQEYYPEACLDTVLWNDDLHIYEVNNLEDLEYLGSLFDYSSIHEVWKKNEESLQTQTVSR